MRRLAVSFLFGTGFLSVGCGGGREEPPLTPAAAASPETATVVERIASAVCDHEQGCNRIGPNAQYASRDHCMNVIRTDANAELGECRYGINQNDVRECLAEIGDEDCSGPSAAIERLESWAACSSQDLCLR